MNEEQDERAEFDAYMATFDFEYETVEPVVELSDTAAFKLFDTLTDVSLDNPYIYTVSNTRTYDYTEYVLFYLFSFLRAEEAEMLKRFESVAVTLADVIVMGSRQLTNRFSDRVEVIPLTMQKAPKLNRNQKTKKRLLALAASKGSNAVQETKKEKHKRARRPSQKKRAVLKKIRSGEMEDFNIKVKSKEWKNWVGK